MDKTNTTIIISDEGEYIDITLLPIQKMLQAVSGKLIIKSLINTPLTVCNYDGCDREGQSLVQSVSYSGEYNHAFSCKEHYEEIVDYAMEQLAALGHRYAS